MPQVIGGANNELVVYVVKAEGNLVDYRGGTSSIMLARQQLRF
jgi:hypothetical protein